MTGLKFTAASFLIAAGVLGAHAAHAADTVVFAGAGASALYNGLEEGALSAFSVTAAGNSVIANNSASVVDTTSGSTVTNAGNAWVVWDSAPAGSRRIAYYVSIDATVGVRAFFNRDTVTFTSSFLASLPADVAAAVQAAPSSPSAGNSINVAGASIRVEDSLVATARTWSFGYTIGNPIKDSGGQSSIPIAFNPASRPYITTPIGASPLIIFVNTTTSGGTNTPVLGSVNNINSLNLVSLYANLVPSYDTGVLGATPGKPLTIFLHDPLSGNHSALDFAEPASQQYSTTQENGVDPVYSNPLNEAGIPLSDGVSPHPAIDTVTDGGASSVGGRVRAIGLSQVIRAVNSTANALGYAFYGVSNFSAANAGNTKYLTLDGVDPLQASYTSGAFPTGGGTFEHIKDGTYRAWSVLRVDTEGTPSSDVSAVINGTLAANNGGNFAPYNQLTVFHSHRPVSIVAASSDHNPSQVIRYSVGANNGRAGEGAELGSDVGGTVYTDALESSSGPYTGYRL